MSFFKRIGKMLSGTGRPDDASYWIAAKCSRCGEIVRARVDLRNDLSIDYGEENDKPVYFCRKVLIGESGQCFQRLEVELTFDANKHLAQRSISGGQFVDE
jgi:hypothetical protein